MTEPKIVHSDEAGAVGMAPPAYARDGWVRSGAYLRTIDGDTFALRLDLWHPARCKPAPQLEVHVRVAGWNAVEIREPEGPRMRDEFARILAAAKRIDVYPTGQNRERVVCHVWTDGVLFQGLLHEALRAFRRERENGGDAA